MLAEYRELVANLTASSQRVADRDAELDEAKSERDGIVRAALAAGVRIPDVMAATGLSRGRVYQIRDGRR